MRKTILDEVYKSKLSVHPGSIKMYKDLKQRFWWSGIMKQVAEYVASCLTCQKAKLEHQSLPKTQHKFDSIWVIVDRLTKSTHFIPVRTTYDVTKLAEIYIADIVRLHRTTYKVRLIQEKMKTAQSRQISYVDQRKKLLEFQEGEHVFLRVTPTNVVGRALKSMKLTPKIIGPFQILRRVGLVTYQIVLPLNLAKLHNVFHVSHLRKYMVDPPHIITPNDIQLKDNISFVIPPLSIGDRTTKHLRGKEIVLVKVIWDQTTGDAT
ncbi:uncharacterized protein [Cicer arietinum]|uniref:uncharacterized protein n=1 Tax=Cicer arietinum TaxID=3827 RepID=UPI003CC6B6AC